MSAQPMRSSSSKFRQLWRLATSAPGLTTRLFAIAELVCFPVSLLSLAALLITAVARSAGADVPEWWYRYTLPICCTAAVGYLTNYLAVRMLFEPYSRRGWHWLRPVTFFLWNQGLVPARKAQLGEVAGREVGERLLTPEAITEEITILAESALDDPDFRARLHTALPELIREHLPELVRKLGPTLRDMLGDALSTGLTRDRLKDFLERVVEPWLNAPANRDSLVNAVVELLQAQSPRVVEFMKKKAQDMAGESQFLGFFISMAEGAGVWDGVAKAISKQLASPEGRREIAQALDGFIGSLRAKLDEPELRPAMEQARRQAGDYVGEMLQDMLERELPERAAALLDRPEVWHWLSEEGIPSLKPQLLQWLRAEGHEVFGKRFDVAGRVSKAIDAMDVRTMHAMVDRIATEQLGAIQVLGFVLGLLAGIPLVLLL